MRILALDLSLTATGWAAGFGDDHEPTHGTETKPGKLRGVDRLDNWQAWLNYRLQTRYDLAVIEGYSFGSKGRAVFSIAEWGGVARLTLYQAGVPFIEIAPAILKKYATGKGNSPKPTMRMELYKRTGLDIADDNEVDAIWLLAAAYQGIGQPLFDMPKTHTTALDKVEWPTVATNRKDAPLP